MSKKHNPNKYLLDICILTAGCVEMFEKCVQSIQSQREGLPPHRVIIYENAVPAETLTQYQKIYATMPDAKVVRNTGKMYGFPQAANNLIFSGQSPLVLFVTDDVVLRPNCIDTLLRRMDDPLVGQCGLKLLFPSDSTDPSRPAGKVQHVGHYMDIRGEVRHTFVGWSADNPRCCQTRQVFSVTGAVFMIRRVLFSRIRGFCTQYGHGTYEDVELSLMVRKLGAQVWVDAEAIGEHHVGATARKLNQAFPLEQNKQIFRARCKDFLVWDGWVALN